MLSSKQLRNLGWPTVIAPSPAPQYSKISYITDTTPTEIAKSSHHIFQKSMGPGRRAYTLKKHFFLSAFAPLAF